MSKIGLAPVDRRVVEDPLGDLLKGDGGQTSRREFLSKLKDVGVAGAIASVPLMGGLGSAGAQEIGGRSVEPKFSVRQGKADAALAEGKLSDAAAWLRGKEAGASPEIALALNGELLRRQAYASSIGVTDDNHKILWESLGRMHTGMNQLTKGSDLKAALSERPELRILAASKVRVMTEVVEGGKLSSDWSNIVRKDALKLVDTLIEVSPDVSQTPFMSLESSDDATLFGLKGRLQLRSSDEQDRMHATESLMAAARVAKEQGRPVDSLFYNVEAAVSQKSDHDFAKKLVEHSGIWKPGVEANAREEIKVYEQVCSQITGQVEELTGETTDSGFNPKPYEKIEKQAVEGGPGEWSLSRNNDPLWARRSALIGMHMENVLVDPGEIVNLLNQLTGDGQMSNPTMDAAQKRLDTLRRESQMLEQSRKKQDEKELERTYQDFDRLNVRDLINSLIDGKKQ